MSQRSLRSAVLVASLVLMGVVTFPSRVSAQSPAPMTELTGVSCLDATVCMAAGTYTSATGVDRPLIEKWTSSGGWKLMKLPGLPSEALLVGLTSIACSGRYFCMALGTYLESATDYNATVPYGFVWHGSQWSLTAVPQPQGAIGSRLADLSCSAATSCLAVGNYLTSDTSGGGLVEYWNGSAWRDFEAGGMDAVSCTTTAGCTSVGRIESLGNESVVVEHWGGASWTPVATLASGDVQDDSYATLAISCVVSRCMVAGEVSDDLGDTFTVAWEWNGTAWSGVPTPPLGGGYGSEDRYFFDAVACAGRTPCTAVGGIATGNELNLGERWNGTGWRVQRTPDLPGILDEFLSAVSCADGRSCLAVGIYNDPTRSQAIESYAESWTTHGWTLTTPIAEPAA
jgi:hypothetical protein